MLIEHIGYKLLEVDLTHSIILNFKISSVGKIFYTTTSSCAVSGSNTSLSITIHIHLHKSFGTIFVRTTPLQTVTEPNSANCTDSYTKTPTKFKYETAQI